MSANPSDSYPAEPSVLLYDHYQVDKVLGRGAMGVVYLARDLRLGRSVALKTILAKNQQFDDPKVQREFLERFKREAELCGSLIHPNIITLYEVGYEGKRISYLAMEYVDGESLLSLLRRHGRLGVEAALKILDDILQGLAYAHDRNVVHRDVKPANVLISKEGEAKVADFGVARYARSGGTSLTDAGQLIGTPYYMSPELIAGRKIDGRSDLFSAGVVLFEMLTGRKPFEGKDLMDVLYQAVNAPTPKAADQVDVPRWVDEFLARLLAKSPTDRFPSAAAASRELQKLVEADDVHDWTNAPRREMAIPVMRDLSPEDTPTAPISMATAERLQLRGFEETRRLWRWDRTVSTGLGLSMIAALLAVLLGVVASIRSEIVESRPRHTAEELAEFQRKTIMIEQARMLLGAGLYEQSRQRFDQYLERYPWATAAQSGRNEASILAQKEKLDAARLEREQREADAVKAAPKQTTPSRSPTLRRSRRRG